MRHYTSMDRSYVSDVERGTASLSIDRLLRLCRAMGVPASTVVARIEERLVRKSDNGRPGRAKS